MLARKKKPDVILNWHPNFRVVATLPDIKQVRTGFLVNFVTIVLALVALAFTLYFEVEIYKVNRDIDVLNTNIASDASTNNKDLAATKAFVNTSKLMQFTARFYSQKLPPLDLLSSLIDARPDNIVFESIEVETIGGKKANTQQVTFKGILTSGSELGLQEFVDKVLASPALKNRVSASIKDRSIVSNRDYVGDSFEFIVTLTLKPVS
jgi:hypothetical protein